MSDPDFEAFDHESHVRRALELAREAADRGDDPFGSTFLPRAVSARRSPERKKGGLRRT